MLEAAGDMFSGLQSLGGSSANDLLQRAAKADPKFKKLAKGRSAPQRLAYLLIWYIEIRRRQVRNMGWEPLSFTEIEAYGGLFNLSIRPWEVDVLGRLDDEWIKYVPTKSET